jgi:hypothetical protein
MARSRQAVISINPLFKALIAINIALCGICLVVMVVVGLTAAKEPTEIQRQLYSACETVFKMTAGAFIGLLAGRAAAPDPTQSGTAPAPASPAPPSGVKSSVP